MEKSVELTAEELEVRRKYKRESARRYREKNRKKYNAYHREWRRNNPDRVSKYMARHWAKKAATLQQKDG